MENQMSFPHIQICILFLTVHILVALYGGLQYWKNMKSYLCQFCSNIPKERKGGIIQIKYRDKIQSSVRCLLLFLTRSFLLLPFHDEKNRQLCNNALLSILHCVLENALAQELEDYLISVLSVTSSVTLGNSLVSGSSLPH